MRSIAPLVVAGLILLAEAVVYALGDSISSRMRGPVLTIGIVVASIAVIAWLVRTAK